MHMFYDFKICMPQDKTLDMKTHILWMLFSGSSILWTAWYWSWRHRNTFKWW